MDALLSVHRQQMQRHIKAVAHEHRKAEVMAGYVARYEAGEALDAIAASVNYSPYLLARQFVETCCAVDRKLVGKVMKAPLLIKDERLRAEVPPSVLAVSSHLLGRDGSSRGRACGWC